MGALIPCRICGSGAWVKEVKDMPGPPMYQVRCDNVYCISNYAHLDVREAVEAWNNHLDVRNVSTFPTRKENDNT